MWVIVCTAWECWRIYDVISHPTSGDLYAYTWSFQLTVFAIFRLPVWFFALAVILAAEGFYRRRVSRGARDDATPTI